MIRGKTIQICAHDSSDLVSCGRIGRFIQFHQNLLTALGVGEIDEVVDENILHFAVRNNHLLNDVAAVEVLSQVEDVGFQGDEDRLMRLGIEHRGAFQQHVDDVSREGMLTVLNELGFQILLEELNAFVLLRHRLEDGLDDDVAEVVDDHLADERGVDHFEEFVDALLRFFRVLAITFSSFNEFADSERAMLMIDELLHVGTENVGDFIAHDRTATGS